MAVIHTFGGHHMTSFTRALAVAAMAMAGTAATAQDH